MLQQATAVGSAILDFLQSALAETSILFVLASAGLGGLIGAGLRLGFDVILPQRYQDARRARRILNKYRNPIVRSADALAGRISILLRNSDSGWIEDSSYFRLSTYYVVCAYFAWVDVLFGHLLRFRYSTSSKNRQVNRIVNAVEKTFNNLDYFSRGSYPKSGAGAPSERQLSKFVCRALGELVVERSERGVEGCIGFREFCRRYREDAEFRAWIAQLDPFFADVRNEYGNTTWDRLHLILLALVALTNYLDPEHEQSRSYNTEATKRLLDEVNDPSARERFAADVARYRLPIAVERRRTHWRRRLRIIIRNSPVIRDFGDTSKQDASPTTIRLDGAEFGLNREDGHRKLCEELGRRARAITDTHRFGVRIHARIYIGEMDLHPDILAGIPIKIQEATDGRIQAQAVSLDRERHEEGGESTARSGRSAPVVSAPAAPASTATPLPDAVDPADPDPARPLV